jgi:hypothetical protein
VEHGAFPKLTPAPIRRRSIENWFAFHRDTPLRYVYGPTGAGKTTATLLQGRFAGHSVAYMKIPPAGTSAAVLDAFNAALDCFAAHLRDIPLAFPLTERFELIIAEIDFADLEVRDFLMHLPSVVPPNVTLTYLARGRRVVDTVALTTKGICAAMDRSLLAFSQAEAAELCDGFGVSFTPADINQLVYASEGWAFAVTGAIRDAAAEGRDLRGALTRWQDRHRRLIDELLARSVAGLSSAELDAAQRIYAGESPIDAPAYDRLHDLGLLLSYSDAELRPLRAVAPSSLKRKAVEAMNAPPINVPVATIEMFGQFEMEIDGRKIEWCRRRDRLIVQYLALQLDTSATRHDLTRIFWPNTDPQLANQSLRTACSTIRRAIAQCVGYDRVHWYFNAGRSLRLNTDHISISSLRMQAHVREAEVASNQGNDAGARAHYVAASRIYRGQLLDSEGSETWFRAQREEYGLIAAEAAERILQLRSHTELRPSMSTAPNRLSFSA